MHTKEIATAADSNPPQSRTNRGVLGPVAYLREFVSRFGKIKVTSKVGTYDKKGVRASGLIFQKGFRIVCFSPRRRPKTAGLPPGDVDYLQKGGVINSIVI